MAISAQDVKELRERNRRRHARVQEGARRDAAATSTRPRKPSRRRATPHGRQARRARDGRGHRRFLHPPQPPRRRARRGELRVGLRGTHGRLQGAGAATSLCRSPAPTRCTSRKTRCPTAARTTRRTSCCCEQPYLKDDSKTIGEMVTETDRQDGREHPHPALRPLRAGR